MEAALVVLPAGSIGPGLRARGKATLEIAAAGRVKSKIQVFVVGRWSYRRGSR